MERIERLTEILVIQTILDQIAQSIAELKRAPQDDYTRGMLTGYARMNAFVLGLVNGGE